MYCDFKTVTTVLFDHVVKSSIKSFTTFINMLLSTFVDEKQDSTFDNSQASKFKTGERIPSKSCVEFYKRKDNTLLLAGIESINPMLADKETLHKFLYDLILNDTTLSNEKRKATLDNHSQSYTNDDALANLIYDALLLAMTRKYKKEKGEKIYHVVSSEKVQSQNACLTVTDLSRLFVNSDYEEPCDSFCGRDEELQELHALVQKKSKVTVVGVKSVGKSELVRAYIKKYASDYEHIGYYHYNVSKSDSFRPRNLWHIISEVNGKLVYDDVSQTEYDENLILLSSLGRNALLVIDSFNVPADYDKKLTDIMRLKCDVILVSYMNYDNMTIYKLRDFRRFKDAYALIQFYYPFKLNDSVEPDIHRIASQVHRNPFLLDVCGKHLAKGLVTSSSLADALSRKDYHNMKALISTTKDGQFQKKANYHELLMRILNTNELSDVQKYVLSYMRFIPEEGIGKLLFANIISLEDINVIEELIARGILQEHKGGCIYLPSTVMDIIETEIPMVKEQFKAFADKVYHLDSDAAPRAVLSYIADGMSVPKYMEMYETDRFYAAHTEFQFNYKLGDVFGMYLLISALSAFRDPDYPEHTRIYNADRKLLFDEFDKIDGAEHLKLEVDLVDERLHSGLSLAHKKSYQFSEEEAKKSGLADDE